MTHLAPLDHPFWDVAASAYAKMLDGATVHQKWTCEHCGARQTMETPNAFYKSGTCEECSRVTDIESRGCNFMLVYSFGGSHND